MSKVPGKAGFAQPSHGEGGTSTAKNKSKVGFTQPKVAAGKTSTKKSPGKVGFTQPNKGQGGTSTKKNPAKAGFDQPNRAGKTAAVPKFEGRSVGKGTGIKKAGKVAPAAGGKKMKSVADLENFRKKKYGS